MYCSPCLWSYNFESIYTKCNQSYQCHQQYNTQKDNPFLGMVSIGIFKIAVQMILLWNTVLFLPLVLFLSYFDKPRSILSTIYKQSGLAETIKSMKDWLGWCWRWLIGRRRRRFEYGYALLKENGRYLDKADHNVFAFQMYDYLARKFLYLQSLTNKSILEVECGSRHGIEYVARNLNAARCVAVNSDAGLIKRLAQNNTTIKVVYKACGIQQLTELGQNDLGRFDCILAIHALGGDRIKEKIEVLKGLLNKGGYICIAENFQNHEIKSFEGLLMHCGLSIVKSQNLTKNILHAIKLNTKKAQTDACFIQRQWDRFVAYFNNPAQSIAADLEERYKFLAYIVENNSD